MKKIVLLFFLLLAPVILCSQIKITVASYNIRNNNNDDKKYGNGWEQRCQILSSLILFHGFEIFGTQEGYKDQLEDMKKNLPGYSYIGVGRDDGKVAGEHSAIFYDTTKFSVIKHGDFWLSQTPDIPSKGWDAVLPRICSWGLFKYLKSNKMILFFNLHMDHIGVQARIESAHMIEKKIKEIGDEYPVILTGDFNVDQNESSYRTIVSSGMLNDSNVKAKIKYQLNGTFNDYDPNTYSESRIDHIFVSNNIDVEKWGVLTDTYRIKDQDSKDSYQIKIPSDHYPIMSILIIK